MRRAIEGHLLDSSAAVRDAAVELIGKYMIDSPIFASDYYQKIADRIAVRTSSYVLAFAPEARRSRTPGLLYASASSNS